MSPFKERIQKFTPVLIFLVIANGMIWTLQAGNESSWFTSNVYVSLLISILHLIGAWKIWTVWQRNRQQQESDMAPMESGN